MRITTLLLLTSSLLTLSGCFWDSTPSQARYQGSIFSNTYGLRHVVGYGKVNPGHSLRFNLSPLSTTATELNITVEFEGSETAQIRFADLGWNPLKLKITGDCANAATATDLAEACWTDGLFTIKQKDTQGQTLFQLELRQSEAPPPADETLALDHPYTLDELLGRAKFMNYAVQVEAERVSRAKKEVKLAAGQLLPSMNIRSVASFLLMDPTTALLDSFSGLVPFIFPSKWYKWDEAKELLAAEKKSYASLCANEMNGVHVLFLAVQRDRTVLEQMSEFIAWQRQLYTILGRSEQLGTLPPGSAEAFMLEIAKTVGDFEKLNAMYDIEKSGLSQAVALPASRALSIVEEATFPNLYDATPEEPQLFVEHAKNVSLEAETLRLLLQAAKSSTKKVAFGILDPTAGIDIGFGYVPQIEISESKEEELKRQHEQALSIIEKSVAESIYGKNGALRSFQVADSAQKSARRQVERLLKLLSVGDRVVSDPGYIRDLRDFVGASFAFDVERTNQAFAYMVENAKLQRLLLEHAYTNIESTTPMPIDEELLK